MTRIKFRYQKNENLATDLQHREAGTVTFTEDSINVCIAPNRVVNFISSDKISESYVPLVTFEEAMLGKANTKDVYGKTVVYRKDETYNREEIDAKILASGQFDSALYFKKSEIMSLLNNKADSNDVYTKYDVDSIVSTKADRNNTYNKNEIETKLLNKANRNDVYSKEELDYKLSLKASSTSTYSREETYSRDEIDLMLGTNVVGPNGTVELSNYYTKRDVDNFLTFKASTTSTYEKSELYTRDETDALLNNKVSISLVGDLALTGLTAQNTISEALRELKNRTDEKANKADTYTKTEVDYIVSNNIPQVDLSSYYNKEEVDGYLSAKADKADTYTKAEVYTKAESDAKIAELISQNQGGSSVDMDNYYTKEEVYSKPETYNRLELDVKFDEKLNEATYRSEKADFALVENTYSKEEVDQKIVQVTTGGSVDLSNYATKQELNTKADASTLDNYYNKSELDSKLDSKADAVDLDNKLEVSTYESEKTDFAKVENVYTKTEVDEKLDNIQLDNYYQKSETYNQSEVDSKLDVKLDTSTYESEKADFATKTELADKADNSSLDNYYNKSEVDEKITQAVTSGTVDLSNYVTKQELNTKADVADLNNKLDASTYELEKAEFATKTELDAKADNSSLGDYYNKTEVDNKLDSKLDTLTYESDKAEFATKDELADKVDTATLGDYYNKTEVDDKISNVDLSNYYDKSEVDGKLTGKVDASVLDNYYQKSEVDEKITQAVTGGTVDLSNYVTKQEIASKADVTDLNNKLDTLTYESEKADFATKTELADKVDTATLVDYYNKSEVDSKLDEKLDSVTYELEKAEFATKTELDTKANNEDVVEINNKLGDLSLSGLNGSTVTELLSDASEKITNRYTKEEVIDLIEHETDSQFNDSIFKYREQLDGLDENIKNSSVGPVYRIPSVTIGSNGTVHIVSDCRDTGNDQERIEVVYARSVDGGKSWTKQVIGHRYKGSGYSEQRSRVMDPTILDAGNGNLFVLAGRWITGSNNWTRNGDTANNWSASLLMKSTDDGRTWTQHTIGKADCTTQEGTHIVVQNLKEGCKGFLGGINAGFRHSSGKLIFQIQFTTGVGDAKSTLLISEDEGINWRMASGDTGGVNYECSMIELSDGSIVLHTRSEDTDAVVDGKSTKKAYITRDFGENWEIYSPLNKKVGSKRGSGNGNRCEGGTLGGTTISGNYICAAAYPQITADSELGHTSDWSRNQITIYACNLNNETVVPIHMLQYRSGLTPVEGDGGGSATTGTPYGGYSSLIYKQTDDGEYIIGVFEDELGISIKNLSHLIPRLEIYSGNMKTDISDDKVSEIVTTVKDEVSATLSADLSTEVKNDVMTTIAPQIKSEVSDSIMSEVNTKIAAWPENFSSFIDTHELPADNVLKVIGADLTTVGRLQIKDSLLVDGVVDSTKLELSDVIEGGLYFKTTSDGLYTIRGDVSLDSTADVISFTLGICIPTGANIKNYTPLIRFFNHATNVTNGSNMGGLEITSDGIVYVTKAKGSGSAHSVGKLEPDVPYTIAAEYTATGVKVYFNGTLMGTYDSDSNKRDGLREATHMCITGQGTNGDKHFNGHIGNITVYGRELTENEKKYGRWFNGKTAFLSGFGRSSKTDDSIAEILAEIRTLKMKVQILENPKVSLLNLTSAQFVAGPISTGDIGVDPYTLELYKATTNITTYEDTATTNTSDIGINDSGLFVGSAVPAVAYKLTGHELSTRDPWTIKVKIKPTTNFTNWKQFFYLTSAETPNSNNETVKGSSSNYTFRLEPTSSASTASLSTQSGSSGNGQCVTAGTSIGQYTTNEEFCFLVTCDGTNITVHAKESVVMPIIAHTAFKLIGFNGNSCCSMFIKELKVFMNYIAKANERDTL